MIYHDYKVQAVNTAQPILFLSHPVFYQQRPDRLFSISTLARTIFFITTKPRLFDRI